jgi:hypothetical protein
MDEVQRSKRHRNRNRPQEPKAYDLMAPAPTGTLPPPSLYMAHTNGYGYPAPPLPMLMGVYPPYPLAAAAPAPPGRQQQQPPGRGGQPSTAAGGRGGGVSKGWGGVPLDQSPQVLMSTKPMQQQARVLNKADGIDEVDGEGGSPTPLALELEGLHLQPQQQDGLQENSQDVNGQEGQANGSSGAPSPSSMQQHQPPKGDLGRKTPSSSSMDSAARGARDGGSRAGGRRSGKDGKDRQSCAFFLKTGTCAYGDR